MRYFFRSVAGIVAALTIGPAMGQIMAVPPAAYVPPFMSKALPVARLVPADAPRRVIALAAPSTDERAALKAANAPLAPTAANRRLGASGAATGKGRPLAIGYGRDVPAASRTIQGADLAWQQLADGARAARIDLTSEGAAAVRIALAMTEQHPDVSLRFVGSSPRAEVFGPYPANSIAEATLKDGKFWSPILEGSTATIEVYAPAGVAVRKLQLTLAKVSHLAVAGDSLRKLDTEAIGIGASGVCEVDVVCVTPPTAALTNAAKSVSKISFTQDDGISYLCTATLINDSTASFTPYLLSANHCLNSQYAATTMNSYWFYDAATCGSLNDPAYVLLGNGAMLLGRSEDWDWVLVRLNSAPPAGSMFAAWRADVLSQVNVPVSTLHHPMGDLKKWSQGTSQGIHAFSDGSSFTQVKYTSGSTEPGSSGSPLLTLADSGAFYEVRGGLFGGDASCRVINGSDYYSRLDKALPLMRQYLTPGSANPSGAVPAVEFYNAVLDDFFITVQPAEIADLDSGVHSGWVRTGLRFLAYIDATTAPPGASPVCRFYVAPNFGDSHFYSADPKECADVQLKFARQWIYEAADVFYILLPDKSNGVCPANSHAIFRFLNNDNGLHHRYTSEVDLRDVIIDGGGWLMEGYGNPPNQVVMCSPDA